MKALKQILQAILYVFGGLFALLVLVALLTDAPDEDGGESEPKAPTEQSANQKPPEAASPPQEAEKPAAEPAEPEPAEEPSPPALVAGEAAITTGQGFACVSEAKFEEAVAAVQGGDMRGLGHLEKTGSCTVLKPGLEASVLDRSVWNGWIKARVYSGEHALEVFALPEALERPSE